ncbi:MAG: GNAT family N-acetyltransferase [Eubacteriales bacterium]|nr:GNAT family N-acetyltransferase [Eubacteriales bacterium]
MRIRHAEMHDEHGAWQMIFSVVTAPEHRGNGFASRVLNAVIDDAARQGRKGLVLTCKARLIPFYSKFGFQNEGISKSVHGNVTWYQMRITF